MGKKLKKKRTKEYNDKDYYQFGKVGWCLNEDIKCFGNCTECTLRRFPELEIPEESSVDYNTEVNYEN